MERFAIIVYFLIHSIRICYQQDINVCPFGTEYFNGNCMTSSQCPPTHYLVNGACLLRPKETKSCGFGFDLINGMCVQQNCPTNFDMINGLCHERVKNQFPLYCPNGFFIHNQMCFPNPGTIQPHNCRPRPCRTYYCDFVCDETTIRPTPSTTSTTSTTQPTFATTTTTTTTTARAITTTTTTQAPEVCPPEYVIIDGECRFVFCLKGTFYKGRCIEPVCFGGLVWTGLRCAKPEVITTILEIKNNFITETNQTGPDFHATKSIDNIVYVTESPEIPSPVTTCKPKQNSNSNSNSNKTCCIIITPRICRKYASKWICFNRQYRQCGEVCGTYSVVYLRVPKVLENSGTLVIPPNPPLTGCSQNECKISDVADCSGCVTNQKETCSPYCYRYRCSINRCTYIDQSEYCTKYRGSPGCSSLDGCFDDYCHEETSNHQDCP